MEISNNEIDELAERILEKYSTCIPVDPLEIASNNNIEVIAGSYGQFFKGLIKYSNGNFFIFLNLDKLDNPKFTIARYTFSHELGHYFIGTHRKKLKSGESIAFTGKDSKDPEKKLITPFFLISSTK